MKLKIATASLLVAAAVGCIFIVESNANAATKYKNTVAQKYWVKYGINPWSNDTDGDKVTDAVEIKKGLCPTNVAKIKLTAKTCLKGVINLRKGTYVAPKNMRPVAAPILKIQTSISTSTIPNFSTGTPGATTSKNISDMPIIKPVPNNASGMFIAPVQEAVDTYGKGLDAKRLADLKQLQTALELYYADSGSYPVGAGLVLGEEPNTCLNSDGWQSKNDCPYPYYGSVPADPGKKQYLYTKSGSNYVVDAVLDGTLVGLSGNIRLSPSGVVKR